MSVNNLRYSKQGAALTEQFEGCRLTAYQDCRGVWTIGYGHTGTGVYRGLTITQQQAEAFLLQDITWAEAMVNSHVSIPLNQNEFDALVDFVFNCGAGDFESSTLLKMINANDLAAAALQFERWDKAGGKVVAGLLRRRLAEEQEFNQAA